MRALVDDQRGAVVLEYLVATSVGLMIALGLVAMGTDLVRQYRAGLTIVSAEYP